MTASTAPAGEQFVRGIGPIQALSLVVGTMIGSGIFIVSADIGRLMGGWGPAGLMLVWLVTGLMTMAGALSYVELAAMMPKAGGQYVYLRESYSPLWGFLYGWTLLLVIQTGTIAAVAVAFARFLGVLFPAVSPTAWIVPPVNLSAKYAVSLSTQQGVAILLIVFLTWMSTRGLRLGKWVQDTFTVAKTLGLVLLIVLGVTVAANSTAIQQNSANVWAGITETSRFATVEKFAPWTPLAVVMVLSGAMVGSLFSADAWYNVTYIAGEVKDPRRTLPWGLLLGTTLVIALYILANVAYLSALPLKGREAAVELRAVEVAERTEVGRVRVPGVNHGVAVRHRRPVHLDEAGAGGDEARVRQGLGRLTVLGVDHGDATLSLVVAEDGEIVVVADVDLPRSGCVLAHALTSIRRLLSAAARALRATCRTSCAR